MDNRTTKKHAGKSAKLIFALVLSLCLTVTMMPSIAFAANDSDDGAYAGKTVVIYTGNLRGDVDVYAKVASAKADYEAKGADAVYLADAGNYLQGTAVANTDRGLSIYNLMDAAGYDVAAMGVYEFSYGDATTGYIYHGNLTKYHTQKQLYEGTDEQTYKKNRDGSSMGTLAAKDPAEFSVICSNLSENGEGTSGYYSFGISSSLKTDDTGLNVGFVAKTDPIATDYLQDGFLKGYDFGEVSSLPGAADVIIGLSNCKDDISSADYTISAPTNTKAVCGAVVIDNATKKITEESLDLTKYADDEDVAAEVAAAKAGAGEVLFTNQHTLNGADRINWKEETNLGDLVTDALLWYANNKFEGFEKDVPVVAIQNGGNCDNFMYTGDVTEADLLRSYPFSPMGVGILYVTGEELLTALEAGTSPSDPESEEGGYGDEICPGFAQVSGMSYNLDRSADYDPDLSEGKGKYGKFFYAASIKRASITNINGEPFDPQATYAVIADNYVLNGNDTYYMFTDAKKKEGAKYLNNGGGTKTRDIVKMYVQEVLGGTVGDTYAAPQDRITQDHIWDKGTVTKKATTKAKGTKTFTCTVCGETKTEYIAKNGFTAKAKAKTFTVKYSKLKKKSQTLKKTKVFKISKAKGTLSFKMTKGTKKITVTKKGVVKIKKGLKKGTYTVKVKVTASGNKLYAKASKTVTFKIKVK